MPMNALCYSIDMKTVVKRHFKKVDPLLFEAAQKIGRLEEVVPRKPSEYFSSLCRSIIGQQLSGYAADAVLGRFHNVFPRSRLTPKLLIAASEKQLRGVGMSWAKARYIKDLAEKVESREVRLSKLPSLADEEVAQELMKIKGVGRWTAEMFLMFSLGREDVFSFGDLGLRRGMEKLYGFESLTEEKAEPIVTRWSPYRTWAARTLWKFLEV